MKRGEHRWKWVLKYREKCAPLTFCHGRILRYRIIKLTFYGITKNSSTNNTEIFFFFFKTLVMEKPKLFIFLTFGTYSVPHTHPPPHLNGQDHRCNGVAFGPRLIGQWLTQVSCRLGIVSLFRLERWAPPFSFVFFCWPSW